MTDGGSPGGHAPEAKTSVKCRVSPVFGTTAGLVTRPRANFWLLLEPFAAYGRGECESPSWVNSRGMLSVHDGTIRLYIEVLTLPSGIVYELTVDGVLCRVWRRPQTLRW